MFDFDKIISIYYLDGKNVDYINTMTCISANEKESHFIF